MVEHSPKYDPTSPTCRAMINYNAPCPPDLMSVLADLIRKELERCAPGSPINQTKRQHVAPGRSTKTGARLPVHRHPDQAPSGHNGSRGPS